MISSNNLSSSILVSVVMPVFNAAQYLTQAVQSVLGQTHKHLELIAVDDGSTDDSPDILADFARRDARVRVIHAKHGGIARALNAGIEVSKGEFIARMDSDDICLPQRLEWQLAFLVSQPECVVVGTSTFLMDEDGCDLHPRRVRHTEHSAIEAAHFAGNFGIISHPTAMIRRKALRQVDGYRELQPAEDLDLWFRLAEVGRLANIPQVLLRYRLRADSVSSAGRELRLQKITQAFTDMNSRRGTSYTTDMIPSKLPYTPRRHAIRCLWLAIRGGKLKTAVKHVGRAVVYF